ncbi:hypothetical protein Q8A73_013900 [Channa argus]|nr:hypothetical protein Q8A73_013900 [Channa argus]
MQPVRYNRCLKTAVCPGACMHDALQKVRPEVSRTFGADEDLVLMGGAQSAETRNCLGWEERGALIRETVDHTAERERGERERGACIQGWIVHEMGQIKKTRTKRNRLTLGGEKGPLLKTKPHAKHKKISLPSQSALGSC